jgi:tRNA A-37 threonylcarbamoyl transferase component Bud32
MSESVVLVAGGVRWQLQPALLAELPGRDLGRLFGPDGLRLDEWLAAGQAQVVKHGPHRTVYRVVRGGLDFHVKHNRAADRRARLREFVRGSKARSEYEKALAVADHGVPTVVPLAVGEPHGCGRWRGSFLITRTLPDTRPLTSFLEETLPEAAPARRARLRQRLAAALGQFLARMHDAGIRHLDLHPGNLLLRLGADDRPELSLIDLHAVRLGALSWRARRANLILFNRWFMLHSERTDRLRFWRAYQSAAACGLACQPAKPRAAAARIAELERGSLASNLRFWRGMDRRCVNANRRFRRFHVGPMKGHAVADLDPEVLAPLLADPDALFARPDVTVLKKSPSSAVVEFDLPGPSGPRRVVCKRFAVTAWTDPWVALVRPPPALRSYVMGHGLLLRRLPTPRPLAVWHRYRHGLCREGYLLTEKVAGARDLLGAVADLGRLPSAPRRTGLRRLIDRVARLVALLHERHLSHRDLKAANVLVSGAAEAADAEGVAVWLIDLVGVRRLRKLRRSRRVQNLARLHASFLGHPGLMRTDKLRFLRVYLRRGLRGRTGWKLWWRQVEAATAAKVRRNLRNGRPLG